jgi:hypothetical protein
MDRFRSGFPASGFHSVEPIVEAVQRHAGQSFAELVSAFGPMPGDERDENCSEPTQFRTDSLAFYEKAASCSALQRRLPLVKVGLHEGEHPTRNFRIDGVD